MSENATHWVRIAAPSWVALRDEAKAERRSVTGQLNKVVADYIARRREEKDDTP